MQKGDLVIFSPDASKIRAGSLTAVKFFARMKDRIAGKIGVIVQIHGNTCTVMFGDDIMVMNTVYLEKINDG
tara:strand:- start:89 stop:304 length:216 start_codon:yes stop_codon:yes gene_type:complete